MAIDVKAWLTDMGFDEAAVTELAPKFASKVEALEKGQLRQSDYSKQMNALKTEREALTAEQTKLQTANDALSAEMAQWAQIQAEGKTATDKQIADLRTAQEAVAKLTGTVKDLATKAGVDPDKALEGVVPATLPSTPGGPAVPPDFDPSKFLPAEAASTLANLSITMPAELAAIAHEHHELTGEWLDSRKIVAEIQTRAQTRGNQKALEPRQVWEELYEIPDKRDAKAKADQDALVAAAEARGREQALAEAPLPGQAARGQHAPIFAAERKSAIDRPQPGGAAGAAAAALRSGKYRQADAGASAGAGVGT